MSASRSRSEGRTIEQRGFEQTGRLIDTMGRPGQSLLDRVFGRWLGMPVNRNWVVDAEWARMQQEPVRARMLLFALVVAVASVILWAAYAPLDEVARGDGRVIPSQQLQIVQSMDGGIVEEIGVREGEVVESGQVLLRIDPTRFVSSLRESRAQGFSLQAEVIRLGALAEGRDPVFPEKLAEEAPEIVAHERRLFEASREEINELIAIHEQQLEQRQQDLREARAARTQHAEALASTTRELDVTRPLLQSGAISEVEILRLEREVSNARGALRQAEAAISRSEAAIAEARNRIREVELNLRNRWSNQLSESQARLEALSEAEVGLADRVRMSEIRAPVRGTVQRLFVNTVGGVVAPGRDVLEIIPLDDQLIIEARLSPRDIAFIRPGQPAVIKLTAYDFAVFGGLDAEVQHISADTITDERDNTYYLVRLKTNATGFAADQPIIPGMTAQVDILTGKKTVLEYLLKPVLRATSNALHER